MCALQPSCCDVHEAGRRLENLNAVMSGGHDLGSYLNELRAQGQSQCTNIWFKGVIAYRCRTCQLNDSSAICVECFQNGRHRDHDYVMYHSESGGCCDCGDQAAWKESGFCTNHQRVRVLEAKVKEELLDATHDVVHYVLKELLAWVLKLNGKQRDLQSPCAKGTSLEVSMAMTYLEWSHQVCTVDALRGIICNDIIEYKLPYQNNNLSSPLNILLDCLGWMPEKLIEAETTLILQLLYQNEFKYNFLNHFRGKYEEMVILAIENQAYMKNYKHLDSNLDRVMVQLFNDPKITPNLINDYNLLELFIGVFSKVINFAAQNDEEIVSVKHDAIKCKVYLRPQGDLRLIVSHGNTAIHLLKDQPQLFRILLDMIAKLQWMNSYCYEGDDVFENSWTLAIQLEMNSMAIIFQLISRCYQDPSTSKNTLVTAAQYTLNALKQYLNQDKSIFEEQFYTWPPSYNDTVSIHIPLHRTLSAILQKIVLLPWSDHDRGFLSVLLPLDCYERDKLTKDEVLRLMEHPLRILVWMAQIRADKWRKTSEEFSRLELIYRGSFWHDQSMDMDVLLLQFCTVALDNMEETIFIKIAEQFNFKEMATTRLTPTGDRRPADYSLLQDFMRLILLIVRERRNLGKTHSDIVQDKCLQYDVIQWLCVRDQTYSQICRALSAIPVDHRRLTTVLERVAIYHEPKVADRGYYQLKSEYWHEFDPLFAHYYHSELEDAEDRAVKVGKLEHYWRIKAPPVAEAPFDRLSSLLHTKACHLFLLNVLDEVRSLVQRDITATAGESLGVTSLQMMSVLVSDSRGNMRNDASKVQSPEGIQEDFPSQDIATNVHVQIRKDCGNRAPDGMPLSIHEMLQDLIQANHCSRLVDSVNHVLELLCLSTGEKTLAAEIDSQGAEDMQRKLRKGQRQKQILEEFAAKRKAFMELHDNSGDDDGSEDEAELEFSNTAGKSSACEINGISTFETITETDSNVAYMAMDASFETSECVLCKRKKDDQNSSTCWIALVQHYNFPCQMLERGLTVVKDSETSPVPTSHQLHGVKLSDVGQDQLVTIGCLDGITNEATTIDFSTYEHVQCCGHKMHFDCFQGHMKTLRLNHHQGNGVVDPLMGEFSCPTCRRLANVLLPDVDASLSTRKLEMHEDGKSADDTEKYWSWFWESNENLKLAVENFCCPVLRIQKNSPYSNSNSPSRFKLSQALWERFALNVVHCEVGTRDGNLNGQTASSSSAPIKLPCVFTWGGDPAHWIALRDLGRLAILSNTLPGAVVERGLVLRKLRESLGLPARRASLPESDTCTESSLVWRNDLEKILQEIFPRNSLDFEEPSYPLLLEDLSSDVQDCRDVGIISKENSGSSLTSRLVSKQETESKACRNIPPIRSALHEGNEDSNFVDHKTGCMHHSGLSAPDPLSLDLQQKHEIRFEDAKLESRLREETMNSSGQLCYSEQDQGNGLAQEKQSTWIPDVLKYGVLTADPFKLLTIMLIIFNGQLGRSALLSMVKFAYTVAILQTQMAVTELDAEGPEMESLVQRACLPFLRRAAILVQVIVREDLKGHGLSGTKVMDFRSLQLALQLPDCSEILQPHGNGSWNTLATYLPFLHNRVSKTFTFKLRKVPLQALLHKLPSVFQELLLVNIHNKRICDHCGEMPADPAICLICGMLLCCGTECCRENGMGECSAHAAKAGVGIFLLLRSTQLLLLRNNRSCMGLSLYLDIHGEPAQEDLYLRRSQLLFLSDLRLNEVQRLWMTAAFDYDSYILRNSQSRPKVY
uniref:E3 ubiquitin-protein ligase n=1 Tax=Physcomitrium patens TaxID=3218 RepID=A0A7I4BEK2_PHYPA